ncbi:hypothetical protein N9P79_00705 [Crocinitomicaceae bacterium]|jgi:hypothetical protein|nr:hypothetical protein [Crocinitomicaceae bacterium]
MPIAFNPMTYIRFFVLLSPIIIPSMAIFGSLYEGNGKGLLYIAGLTLSMAFGAMISPLAGAYVPHVGEVGGSGRPGTPNGPFTSLTDPACNLISSGTEGWGTMFSMPGPHALLLSFTMTYMLFPMFMYGNVNLWVIGGLLFLGIMSARIRTTEPMNCVGLADVMAGWGTGVILGSLWFFTIIFLMPDSDNVVYFSSKKSDKQECKLEKKAFRCKSKQKAK